MALKTEDRALLKASLQETMNKVPVFLKGMVGPSALSTIQNSIPESLRGYTIGDVLTELAAITKEPDFKW